MNKERIIICVLVVYIALFSPLAVLMIPHQIILEYKSYTPATSLSKSLEYFKSCNVNGTDDNYLDTAKFIPLGNDIHGPESMVFSKNGKRIYFALKNGEISYIEAPFTSVDLNQFKKQDPKDVVSSNYLTTVGRPLGITIDGDDNVIIADSVKGLLRYNIVSGVLEILTSTYNKSKLNFVNDVVVSETEPNMIYFSDSTSLAPILDKTGDWNTLIPSTYTIVASVKYGKLLSFNTKTKETKMLLGGLKYANGVTMDSKEQSVFVAESGGHSIHRVWIKGTKAGTSEIFIDSLPGVPDGIIQHDGKLYISLFGGRTWVADLIMPYPILKAIFHRIPFVKPPMARPAMAIVDSTTGKVLGYYQTSPSTIMKSATSSLVDDKNIYIGNLLNNFISVVDKK